MNIAPAPNVTPAEPFPMELFVARSSFEYASELLARLPTENYVSADVWRFGATRMLDAVAVVSAFIPGSDTFVTRTVAAATSLLESIVEAPSQPHVVLGLARAAASQAAAGAALIDATIGPRRGASSNA